MTNSEDIYQAVLERYVGRQPGIVKAENELSKLIQKILEGHFSILQSDARGDISAKEINESVENKTIQTHLKKVFNVKELRIVWIYTAIPNASTPVKSFPMLDKNYGVDSKGVDYNENLIVTVFLNTGLFTHINLAVDEAMAMILHEIGHNFYQSIFHTLTRVNPYTILSPMFDPTAIPVQGLIAAISAGVYDFMDTGAILKVVKGFKDNIIDSLGLRKIFMATSEISIVLAYLSPSTLITILALLKGKFELKVDPFNVVFNYSVEKHADSFAVDYGYGTALASALNKLDQRVNSVKYDIPVIGWIYDLEALVNDVLLQTFSGYPTNHNRQQSVLKRLKISSKDPNIPKDVRLQLERDIEEFEKYYENYSSISNDENKKRVFTWLYRKVIVDGVFKGNIDLREMGYNLDKTHASKDLWEPKK